MWGVVLVCGGLNFGLWYLKKKLNLVMWGVFMIDVWYQEREMGTARWGFPYREDSPGPPLTIRTEIKTTANANPKPQNHHISALKTATYPHNHHKSKSDIKTITPPQRPIQPSHIPEIPKAPHSDNLKCCLFFSYTPHTKSRRTKQL